MDGAACQFGIGKTPAYGGVRHLLISGESAVDLLITYHGARSCGYTTRNERCAMIGLECPAPPA